jgi:hypothetical protein
LDVVFEVEFEVVFEVEIEAVFEVVFLGILGGRSTAKLTGMLLVGSSTATVKVTGLQEAVRGTFLRGCSKEVVGGSEGRRADKDEGGDKDGC